MVENCIIRLNRGVEELSSINLSQNFRNINETGLRCTCYDCSTNDDLVIGVNEDWYDTLFEDELGDEGIFFILTDIGEFLFD
jgi:hypothetical protein